MRDGVLNLNKPAGITSAAAVGRVKRMLPRGTKIGHAGTLDPFATGVLLLLMGRGTKLCEKLMDAPKRYEATIKLGATTETDDPETPEQVTGAGAVSSEQVDAALPAFVGAIRQTPPVFSAMKVGGLRSYALARAGQAVALRPRTVQVYRLERLSFDWPLLRVRIDCGRGTYIRAIARDLGQALGTGAYLTLLGRTRVGRFSIEQSAELSTLSAESLPNFVVDVADAIRPEA